MKITDFFSPNFDKKIRPNKSIKIIIIHYTGMQSERESLLRLCNRKSKVSSHFFINTKGKIYRLIQSNKIAWHAGKSCWGKYKIKRENIVGHSDIAPLRKIDPGEKFPWEKLAYKQIGIWHNLQPNILRKYRNVKIFKKREKEKFIKSLIKIGYCFSLSKKYFFKKIIKAFQRHYRKELINGKLDKECLIIAQNLSKKL